MLLFFSTEVSAVWTITNERYTRTVEFWNNKPGVNAMQSARDVVMSLSVPLFS